MFVRFNSGYGFPVEISPNASILQLKEEVAKRRDVPIDQLCVIFVGKELRNDLTLQNCNLMEQSTIHVVQCTSQLAQQPMRDTFSANPMGRSGRETVNLSKIGFSTPMVQRLSTDHTVILGHSGQGSNSQSENSGSSCYHRFYVYCKTVCKAVQPGKLRVRCNTCKQGTLTLAMDPTCWEDVLEQNRMTGICQAKDCNGTVAEFYFKCGKHPTSESDTSVVLNLITPNRQNVPCITCTDTVDPVLVFPCEEQHVICLDCFYLYCVTRLNDRRFIHDPQLGYSLSCVTAGQASILQAVAISLQLLDFSSIFRLRCSALTVRPADDGTPNSGPQASLCLLFMWTSDLWKHRLLMAVKIHSLRRCITSEYLELTSTTGISIMEQKNMCCRWGEYCAQNQAVELACYPMETCAESNACRRVDLAVGLFSAGNARKSTTRGSAVDSTLLQLPQVYRIMSSMSKLPSELAGKTLQGKPSRKQLNLVPNVKYQWRRMEAVCT
ncbi:E3 ubiquitin-protein ligase parkin isoform X2 [Mobula hypostoma]|uniref:E3 ubiquitin-protein ligase parkin isoform X2 n=1 Tax=Mobula hypostoma TaxID=723540 RepID=UPI002FC31CCD